MERLTDVHVWAHWARCAEAAVGILIIRGLARVYLAWIIAEIAAETVDAGIVLTGAADAVRTGTPAAMETATAVHAKIKIPAAADTTAAVHAENADA